MRASFLVALFFALLAITKAQGGNYVQVVKNLPSFQQNGAFYSSGRAEAPTVAATADAMLLASLYGFRDPAQSEQTIQFVRRLANGDAGYGSAAGRASDLTSVKHALSVYKNLGAAIPNNIKIGSFVRSLYDSSSGMFRLRSGASPSIHATVLAFEIFDLLGDSNISEYTQKLKQLVEEGNQGDHFAFAGESGAQLSVNYDGLYLCKKAGLNVEKDKFVDFIVNQQRPDGSFGSIFVTADAVRALVLLNGISSIKNTKGLTSFYTAVPADIHQVAAAHTIGTLTKLNTADFGVDISFEGVSGDVIMQGTQVKPVIRAPAGYSVKTTLSQNGAVKLNSDLAFNDIRGAYTTSDSFDSSAELGDVNMVTIVKKSVSGLGDVELNFNVVKSIGYGVSVTPTVTLSTGKNVRVGERVTMGTQFEFEYKFRTDAQPDIKSGDFEVIFSVLDSSNVEIHRESLDGKTNQNDIAFSYTLNKPDVPAGTLSFRVQVVSKGKAHTVHDTKYTLTVEMVASKIEFIGHEGEPSYQINDEVVVSMVPGSFPDLRTVYPLSGEGRTFALSVATPEGMLIRRVAGEVKGDTVQFTFPVAASLISIGSNVITFSYYPVVGEPIDLKNYDSAEEELRENPLTFKVTAQLQMSDVAEEPTSSEFSYGNSASYKFKVKDALSGAYIEGGNEANVYLELEHDSGKGASVSASQPATLGSDGSFLINWDITPNAVRGKGKLNLIARDADGNKITIQDATGNVMSRDVTIGGEIQVVSKSFATSNPEMRETAFISQFSLSCNEKSLENAQLSAVISKDGVTVTTVPVVSLGGGSYQASWTSTHKDASAGTYAITVYRDVDLSRTKETRAQLLARKEVDDRRKQTEAEARGSTFTPEAFDESQVTQPDPLFDSLSIYHEGSLPSSLPVRTEFVVLVLSGIAFFVTFYQRYYKYAFTK